MGSNPAGGHGSLSVVSVVCCQVDVSATGSSLVQGRPTDCGVSECDREASIMRRHIANHESPHHVTSAHSIIAY